MPQEAMARKLFLQAGLAPDTLPGNLAESLRVERLPQGRNNQSFRVEGREGPCLLKQYFRHPGDPRDRQGTELAFLTFCREAGIASVPRALAADREAGWSLFSWLAGRPATTEDVTPASVAEVGRFLQTLAEAGRAAPPLPPASEACFSLQDHFDLARKRLQGLRQALSRQEASPATRAATRAAAQSAEALLRRRLSPWLEAEVERLERRYSPEERKAPFPRQELLPSPSDIGFHNVLVTPHGLSFVDFEYAGTDDAAKALCDLVCQPDFPLPERCLEALSPVCGPECAARILTRAKDVLALHRIKWCCILLNVFRRTDAERRRFAGEPPLPEVQLEKCATYLNRLA